jgi:hypothetical protein
MSATPGPWVAYVSETGSFEVDATHDGLPCAIASRGPWERNRAASAANAHLIAAAPDLLSALTKFMDACAYAERDGLKGAIADANE